MIKFVDGNILDDESDALVNPVNCVGVMGKGLAKQFKERFPDNFEAYQRYCASKALQPGGVHAFYNQATEQMIFNAATKGDWREHSNIQDITKVVLNLAHKIKAHRITSIAIPQLGCGLGGLKWEYVRPLLLVAFQENTDVVARIYGPSQ